MDSWTEDTPMYASTHGRDQCSTVNVVMLLSLYFVEVGHQGLLWNGMEGINMEWLKKGTVEKQDQEQRVELERHSVDCIIGYIHLFLFSIR